MNANIDKRSYSILQSIVNNQPSVTGKDLEKMFGITKKQLSYSVQKINDYLTTLGYKEIKRENTGFFIVPYNLIDKFSMTEEKQSSIYIVSDKERLYLIILILFSRTEEISVNHFTSELKISKNTLLSDIKKIRLYLQKYDMYLLYTRKEGYFISGSEYAKRQVMINIIKKVLIMPEAETILFKILKMNKDKFKTIQEDIEILENNLKVKFTDERIKELPYIIYVIILRISLGKVLHELPDVFNHISDTKEYYILLSFISRYNIKNEMEALYLTSQIQISKIYSLEKNDLYEKYDLVEVAKQIIINFECLCGIRFKATDELLQLLIKHCTPAYYRIKYGYHLENNIVDLVLPEYMELHQIVKKSIVPLETLIGMPIDDEELVYITILFGASLNKEGLLENVTVHICAIIVCINGVAVTNYLLITLKQLFPQIDFLTCLSARDYKDYKGEYDIIFSTVKLKTDKMLFMIEPFADETSKENFKKRVLEELEYRNFRNVSVKDIVHIVEKYSDIESKEKLIEELKFYIDTNNKPKTIENSIKPNFGTKLKLNELLKRESIKIFNRTMDWKEAIEMTSYSLLYSNKIYPRYVKKMIDIIEEEKPYIMIAEGVAIAHAGIHDGVRSPGMAITILPEKISFNGYIDIDIVVVLATTDTKIHLNALFELIEILEDGILRSQIKKAKTVDEVVNLMKLEKNKGEKIC